MVGIVLLVELVLVLGIRLRAAGRPGDGVGSPIPSAGPASPTPRRIGRVLYTQYVYFFQGAGLILLVAMIGAIVLTLRHKEGVKRQSIAAQVARGPTTAIEVVKVASGRGIVPWRAAEARR